MTEPNASAALPFESDSTASATEKAIRRATDRDDRANDLTGKEWTRNSISVWSDIKKDAEELEHNHPAMFPKALVRRCLESFTTREQRVVLDPFMGSGSSVLAAWSTDKMGIGLEISEEYVALAKKRLDTLKQQLFDVPSHGEVRVIKDDARCLLRHVGPETVDICVTSPPYWNILTERRSADYKTIRNYGDHPRDLGRIDDYREFLVELASVFEAVYRVLKPSSYCLINVMDLRKGATFYPFHSDLAIKLTEVGFTWDDLIIWDRRSEYNNMRPLGYPTVFRINKAHEFILVMQKRK